MYTVFAKCTMAHCHRRSASSFILRVVACIFLFSLIVSLSAATGPDLGHVRPRKTFFFLHMEEMKAIVKNSTQERYVLVHVSTFRNATDFYFNLILEKQPLHMHFYQDAHVDDDELVKLKRMAPAYNLCLTLLYSYHLRNEHSVRHVVVFTGENGRNCSDVQFICNQNSIVDVQRNIDSMSNDGYVHTSISSFENYQGLHYTTKFVKSSHRIYWQHEMRRNLLRYIRKAKLKKQVPFFLGGTYNGLPRESPEVFSLLRFKSSVPVQKGDFAVVQYWMSNDVFSVDLVQRRLKAAYSRKGTPLVPVSTIVQYRLRRISQTLFIRDSKLIILLVSPKLLQQARELL